MKKKPKHLGNKVTELQETPRDKKLPRGVVNVKGESTEHESPVFSFDFADDNRFVLWESGHEYLKQLMKTLKLMGAMSWGELRRHHGLGMKIIETRHSLPERVSPDIELIEVRVSQEGRLHGFRLGKIFQILWFDPTHDVCPENKLRR